jgi:diacylglycerol kinase
MLQKTINSFVYALRGLRTTWKEEHNFRIEVWCSVILFFCLYYFQFTMIESVLCILAATIVLCAEIINTSIEDLCNKVEPQYDPVIGKIKDVTSAFVLVAVLGSILVGIFVFYSHFS